MVPLRLALATPRFWPHIGDGPTHLLRLAESLIGLGHSVPIVTPQWKRTWPPRMWIGAIPVVRLRGNVRGGWGTLRWMYGLSGWLKEQPLNGVLALGLK